jgi:peptidoglycan pentaglycine glycine transferase (the first glycine)
MPPHGATDSLPGAADSPASARAATRPPCAGFALSVDSSDANPGWDSFVARTPGGHHAQTSLWGQVKAVLGWKAARLILRDGDEVIGGVQLLTRSVARGARVGFAPRGPLLAVRDRQALQLLHDGLMAFGRSEGVRYMKVQPPTDRHDLVPALEGLGWTQSAMEAAPTASLRIDLCASTDDLLAQMHRNTRARIRQGERKGLRVRVGDEADLSGLYRMIEATSRRQGFSPYPSAYYETMYRAFAAQDCAALVMCELEGRLLAAQLLVAFGDSATSKMAGWGGERTLGSPNEPMQWTAIRWSQERGYRWFDFDGLAKSVAVALSRGEPLPEFAKSGVTYFKLGFGGQAALFPGALDTSPNRLLRPLVRVGARRADRALSIAHRALGRGR